MALAKLYHSAKAFYDADLGADLGAQHVHRFCHEGTRVKIIDNIKKWAEDPNSPSGYWICGMAGTGKSTIAMSICESFAEQGTLAGSFFCSHQIPECNKYGLIIPTLAYQLATHSRGFAFALRDVLSRNPDIASKKPKEQVQRLLIDPWQELITNEQINMKLPVIVVDALDECEGVEVVLEPLINAIQGNKLPRMKLLLTSRPKHAIEQLMHSHSSSGEMIKVEQFILHQVEETEVQEDIRTYVESELKSIASELELQMLTNLSGKLFIYAATTVKFVKGVNGSDRQQERLTKSLKHSRMSQDLQQLYNYILHNAFANLEPEEEEQDWKILHTLVSLSKPLTCKALADLVLVSENKVKELIDRLHAVCFVSDAIYTFHLSFPEFITNSKSYGKRYSGDTQHHNLSQVCFRILLDKLKFNICDLPSSFLRDAEVEGLDGKIKENVGDSLEYCCRHWSDHVKMAQPKNTLMPDLQEFLQEKGVFWIEVMSLMRLLPRCGEILEGVLQVCLNTLNLIEVKNQLLDLRNLVMLLGSSNVNGMTPHLYLSIIPFWKRKSKLKVNVKRVVRLERQIMKGPGTMQVALLQAPGEIHSVAYSSDGTRIVSGSSDRTVRIWDATTGTQIGHPLHGHDHFVLSVAFSPDGTRIVSGSLDRTVRIWDTTTGTQIGHPLHGHDDFVSSVAFSPDGTRVLSGSEDRTVRIWDATTGTQIGNPLHGHNSSVYSVAFSPDGTRIVSGSWDRTVRIWNATTGTQIVAFSPDGTRIVSGSKDWTMRIWDATTGTQIGNPLHGHDSSVYSVAFSPDGTRIVSGSEDRTVRIWDAATGTQISDPLHGHNHLVSSVAFSPDGTRIVSGSKDRTVRILDATIGTQSSDPIHGHDDSVQAVAFSPDGTRIVSGSWDRTVRIWNATTGTQIGDPLHGHDDFVSSVAFSPEGTRIVSGSLDGTVRIWDATAGTQIGNPLHGHDGSVLSVAFSPDGTRIVDWTVRIWDATTGTQIGDPLHGHDDSVQTVRIWDATTGTQIGHSLHGHNDSVWSVAFSSHETRIVSGSLDRTVRIWDATTGTQIGDPLHGHDESIQSVAFSPDGTRIVSGSKDRTVRIWDATTASRTQIIDPLHDHDDYIQSVEFSSDGTSLSVDNRVLSIRDNVHGLHNHLTSLQFNSKSLHLFTHQLLILLLLNAQLA
ncbi:hypothetical protein GYMLUDRAFT_981954 [Collybiopsis luxurians FD-317 M1]|nr:hypothetical protein GYMLUDRAFT_981954 [Collybiopsis luxurians FD-317 M1]